MYMQTSTTIRERPVSLQTWHDALQLSAVSYFMLAIVYQSRDGSIWKPKNVLGHLLIDQMFLEAERFCHWQLKMYI